MDYLKYVHVPSKIVGTNKKLKRRYFLNADLYKAHNDIDLSNIFPTPTFNQFNPAYSPV